MSILNSLIAPVTSLLDKFIEDKDQRNTLAHEISTLASRQAQELAKGQLEINKTEAAHKSLFVAGWRPFCGWVCCLSMASNFLIIPMANFALALSSSPIHIPLIELSEMMPVLIGMLGFGAYRTIEKRSGVQRDN